MSEAGLTLREVYKAFKQGSGRLEVLRGADLAVASGEMVALVGPSGAGKSTLLQIAGLLEKADSGAIMIGAEDAAGMGEARRTALRGRAIGFVYQYHHLLPEFSAIENVMMPQIIQGMAKAKARERAGELLHMVGLSERAKHRPGQLSGGEQQRVAIARALANAPGVLLADEPTGNLDEHTSDTVFGLLQQLVHQTGVAALIATHNLALANRMDRRLRLHEGRIETVERSTGK